MKKYIILLIVPLLFCSIGCDKDEENGPDYSELILGHWKIDYVEFVDITGYIDPVFGTEIKDTLEMTLYYPNSVLFTNDDGGVDGYLLSTYRTYKYDGTRDEDNFFYDPNDLDLNNPVWSYSNTVNYNINGDIIEYDVSSLPYNDYDEDKIIHLTEENLQVRYDIQPNSWEQGDTTYFERYLGDYYLSKVNELPPTPRSSTQQLKRTVDILERKIKPTPSH